MINQTINKKAFTLIELLVVVLIIGILAAIALPKYQAFVMRAKLAEVEQIVQSYISAQERYRLATGKFAYFPYNDKFDITLPVFNINSYEDRKETPSKIIIDHATGDGYFIVNFTNTGVTSRVNTMAKNGIGLRVAVSDKQGKIGIIRCLFTLDGFGGFSGTFKTPPAKACESAGYKCEAGTDECPPNPPTWWSQNYFR